MGARARKFTLRLHRHRLTKHGERQNADTAKLFVAVFLQNWGRLPNRAKCIFIISIGLSLPFWLINQLVHGVPMLCCCTQKPTERDFQNCMTLYQFEHRNRYIVCWLTQVCNNVQGLEEHYKTGEIDVMIYMLWGEEWSARSNYPASLHYLLL